MAVPLGDSISQTPSELKALLKKNTSKSLATDPNVIQRELSRCI